MLLELGLTLSSIVEDTCEDGDVRLVGGSDAKDGRVEICRDNVWGTVCSDTWNDNNNRVICKQLGLHGKSLCPGLSNCTQ